MTAPPPGYPPGPPQPGPPTGPQPPIGPPSGPIPVGQHQPGPQQPIGPYQSGGPQAPPHHQAGPYQPPYAAGPRPAPRRPPGSRWTPGLLAAFLFLIATAAAVWGTFEKIQTYREGSPDSPTFDYAFTWWDFERASERFGPEPAYGLYGLLPAVAAGLLLIGAVLALTAFSTRRAGAVTGARVASALGVGLLTGAVLDQLIEALDRLSDVNDRDADPGETITFDIGLGVWLPLGAVGVALIGLVLVLTRARPAAVRLEPDTPRMGFPAPYGPGPHQPPTPQQFQPQQPAAPTGPQPSQGPPTGPPEATPAPPAEPERPPEAPPERT